MSNHATNHANHGAITPPITAITTTRKSAGQAITAPITPRGMSITFTGFFKNPRERGDRPRAQVAA